MADRTDDLLRRYFDRRVESMPSTPAESVELERDRSRRHPAGHTVHRGEVVVRAFLAAAVAACIALPALVPGRIVSPSFTHVRPGVEVAAAIESGIRSLVKLNRVDSDGPRGGLE